MGTTPSISKEQLIACDCHQIAEEVTSLGTAYSIYKDCILSNAVAGDVLTDFADSDEFKEFLEDLGISNRAHKRILSIHYKKIFFTSTDTTNSTSSVSLTSTFNAIPHEQTKEIPGKPSGSGLSAPDKRFILQAIRSMKCKVDIPSRTASQRFEARKEIPFLPDKEGTFFGIPLIQNFQPYKFPVLPSDTLEDFKDLSEPKKKKSSESGLTVQSVASEHIPKFEVHLKNLSIDLTSKYQDTHSSPFKNGAKPDCSHVSEIHGHGMTAVKVLGDLKRRRLQPSFSPSEQESVIAFAMQWLLQEPYRPFMIVYLTDMHYIQFFYIPNLCSLGHNDCSFGDFSSSSVYEIHEKGQHLLASLLVAEDSITGFPSDRLFPVYFKRIPAHFDRFLGKGRASLVFEMTVDDRSFAVKLCKNAEEARQEYHNLQRLWESIDELPPTERKRYEKVIKNMIPRLDFYLLSDDNRALRMEWVGSTVAWDRHLFAELVNYLRLLHRCGYVHRDISPNNLVYVENRIVVIDYCSLCLSGKLVPFHGTGVYASEDILNQLKLNDGLEVAYHPNDDLLSLVRTIYFFLVKEPTILCDELLETGQDPEKLIPLWRRKLGYDQKRISIDSAQLETVFSNVMNVSDHITSMWLRLEEHASLGNYDALHDDILFYLLL